MGKRGTDKQEDDGDSIDVINEEEEEEVVVVEDGDNAEVDDVSASSKSSSSNKGFLSQLKELVSKLKPGEDLTHRSMPASFMAPRSLLELFTEASLPRFYLLIDASQQRTPALRMLGVVRYLFMTFFVNQVGKKPFNPVLGETYDAYTRLEVGADLGLPDIVSDAAQAAADSDHDGKKKGPASTLTSTATSADADARVRAAHARMLDENPSSAAHMKGSVYLRVEQTSHHPPEAVSVAVHRESGVSITRTLSSSARFLGTHARVEQSGTGSIRFENIPRDTTVEGNDNDNGDNGISASAEHYVATRPPDIVFRIFRMASEYVGKLSVFCPETGYGATLKFKDKPTIGGNWHDIAATVWRVTGAVAPKKKSKSSSGRQSSFAAQHEVVYEITGNWATGMRVKHTEKSSGAGKKKLKKQSTAPAATDENEHALAESRWKKDLYPPLLVEEDTGDAASTFQIWGSCMEQVLQGDMSAANASKDAVEREQRRIAAQRTKSGEPYKVKSFVPASAALNASLLPQLVHDCGGSLEDATDSLAEIDEELPQALRNIPVELSKNVHPKETIDREHRRIRTLWQEHKAKP